MKIILTARYQHFVRGGNHLVPICIENYLGQDEVKEAQCSIGPPALEEA